MNSEMTSTYLEERILSATPLELIAILYDAAIDRLRAARLYLSTGDAMERSKEVSKALEILSELTLTLNDKEAKDSAATYSAIYLYLQRRLVEAHSRKDDAIFAEVEEMLASLAENWRGIREMVQKSRAEMDASGAGATAELLNADPEQPARSWNL